MKYLLIMIVLSVSMLQLVSKDLSPSRADMLREGKHLTQRYDHLQNKRAAWLQRKKVLLSEFDENNLEHNEFGDENRYGEARTARRRETFHTSLMQREEELEQEMSIISERLEVLKTEFLQRFAVPMTRKEMFGGVAPKVLDKKRKVRLLQGYIRSNRSWRTCLSDVERFDAKRVALEIRSDLSERRYNSLSLNLDKKVEKNFISLSRYEEKSNHFLETYALDYGYYIPDVSTAKVLLKNIQKAR